MPRWKALPDDLDPQVREFAGQLRRLVDGSGLSIAAVADRTGYSKTSWERYLNGRLLAPKGAIVALAEVTGTPAVHLVTMWELAERAWSRSEMRHDMTMQAIRISQARAALGEVATPNPPKSKGGSGKARGGVGAVTGVAGPAGVSPTVPPRQESARYGTPAAARSGAAEAGAGAGPGTAPSAAPPASTPYSTSSSSASSSAPSAYEASATPPTAAASAHASAATAYGGGARGVTAAPVGPDGKSPDGQRRKRKLTMFLAGVVGALVVIGAAAFLTGVGRGDKDGDKAKPSATPTTSTADLPAGVECNGAACAGKDPENMGCGGEFARTTARVTVGTKTLVEVRYSKTCGAAWARITQAKPGDKVQIRGSDAGAAGRQSGTVGAAADVDAYTPMVAVKSGTQAKACATLASGQRACTK
ncbi:helix-turn-helix domain-containing protein [Streptomyces sp. NRRL B-1347]|uniref:helix-turn-helix domain-containing protein n=1 Tax=Streptomyces sp. NRRL B-1347 TaxID=1476877 RepID=UPI0004CC6145|nr:XRE family transcriptional regulator [Streptomyces sp. NRRL B-1347]